MAEGLDELKAVADHLAAAVQNVPKQAGKPIGAMGEEEVNRVAIALWGSARRFSGSANSRKARRPATVRASIRDDVVTIYPNGDPWYITMRGRAPKEIFPRKGRGGLAFPDGGVRRSVMGGALQGRPEILDDAVSAINRRAPEIVSDALNKAIAEALRG